MGHLEIPGFTDPLRTSPDPSYYLGEREPNRGFSMPSLSELYGRLMTLPESREDVGVVDSTVSDDHGEASIIYQLEDVRGTLHLSVRAGRWRLTTPEGSTLTGGELVFSDGSYHVGPVGGFGDGGQLPRGRDLEHAADHLLTYVVDSLGDLSS